MDGPVTLLLVVSLSGGEVQPAQLQATLAAYLDPHRVSLTLRGADGVEQLEHTLEAASARGPVAVITGPRRGEVHIRAALQPGVWVSRTLTFAARDPLLERNRTVALALVAMVPEWKLNSPLPEHTAPATPVQPLTAADPPARATPASAPPAPSRLIDAATAPPVPEFVVPAPSLSSISPALDAGLSPSTPPEVNRPSLRSDAGPGPSAHLPTPDAGPPTEPDAGVAPGPRPPTSSQALTLSVDVAGLAGYWPMLPGGLFGAHLCFTEHLCAGLLVEAQTGTLAEAEARLWRVLPQVSGRAEAGLGLERLRGAVVVSAGPLWLQAVREGQTQSRWQLEVALEAELAVRLVGAVSVFARGGPTLVSGTTPILINTVQVTELPVFSGRAELGLRITP